MSDLKRLIKTFDFEERERDFTTLSDPAKIRQATDSGLGRIVLNNGTWGMGDYPLDTDLFVKTKLTNPNGIKQWLLFEAVTTIPVGTTINYRLYNDTRELYHDGVDWVTAGVSDWNTEEEIKNNIQSFPFDNNTIGVIANLVTTDPKLSPELFEIRLLGNFEFEIYEDLMLTLLSRMHDDIRPCTDVLIIVSEDKDTFDLKNEIVLENDGYNIVDVERVYDLSSDPYQKDNLLNTYTQGPVKKDPRFNEAGVFTTTRVINSGSHLMVKVKYVPVIADYTSEDYYYQSSAPAIAFEEIEEIKRDNLTANTSGNKSLGTGLVIRDIANLTAVEILPPAQIDMRFGFAVYTKSDRDQKRLLEAIERFLQKNVLLYSLAFDEPYMLVPVQRLKYQPKGATGDLRRANGIFDIRGIRLYEREALDVNLIGQVNMETTTCSQFTINI